MKNFFIFNFLMYSIIAQNSPNVYWNSLATDVTVGVPLVDDPTLIGGRVQVKVSFDNGKILQRNGRYFYN